MAKEYIEPTKELIIPIYKEEKERETKFLDGRFHPFSWGLLVEEARKTREEE